MFYEDMAPVIHARGISQLTDGPNKRLDPPVQTCEQESAGK